MIDRYKNNLLESFNFQISKKITTEFEIARLQTSKMPLQVHRHTERDVDVFLPSLISRIQDSFCKFTL